MTPKSVTQSVIVKFSLRDLELARPGEQQGNEAVAFLQRLARSEADQPPLM